jgi:ribosomal protein S27E
MPIQDRIECQNCGRAVVPQLWVDTRNRLEHPRFVRLCPFCGIVMSESGGGMDRGKLAFILGVSGLCFFFFLLMAIRH